MGLFGDNERMLISTEEFLIRSVFKSTSLPPLSQIRIRDGLSPTGTPFTDKDYSIMVGPDLYDTDLSQSDPSTLVHEMTHVWQYMHSTLTRAHAISAHIHYWMRGAVGGVANAWAKSLFPNTKQRQIGTNELYEYNVGDSWNDFGFEGQAQLVEEWFTIDRQSQQSDRFIYIKKVLYRGDVIARELPLEDLRDKPPATPGPSDLDADARQISFEQIPFSDDYLINLLRQPFQSNDVPGLGARVSKLQNYCKSLRKARMGEAITLAGRFDAPRPGDQLAQAFHYNLSTPTRVQLIKVLRGLA